MKKYLFWIFWVFFLAGMAQAQINPINAARFKAKSGTALLPAFTFTTDGTTGLYYVGSYELGFTTNGVKRLGILSTGATFTVPVTATSFLSSAADGKHYLDVSNTTRCTADSTSEGWLAWDQAKDMLTVSYTSHHVPLKALSDAFVATLTQPDSLSVDTDRIGIWSCPSFQYPGGAVVTGVKIDLAAALSPADTLRLIECTSASTGTDTVLVCAIDSAEEEYTSITAPVIAAGSNINVDLKTTAEVFSSDAYWIMITLYIRQRGPAE